MKTDLHPCVIRLVYSSSA